MVQGLGLRVWGLGLRVWGLGLRGWALGLRVEGLPDADALNPRAAPQGLASQIFVKQRFPRAQHTSVISGYTQHNGFGGP